VVNWETGEITLRPLGCGRNGCPVCRRRNVQITAAKMGINQGLTDRPVTHAVLSTTRDWVSQDVLASGWKEMARLVRRDVCSTARYAWFREFTDRDATHDWKRTHYHSTWALDSDDQAQAVAEISNHVWASRAGAWAEKAHGWQRVWDAGGLTRYIAGLVGHHLKANQSPPPGWTGRRFGTSKGFYAIDSRDLDRDAKAAVRDDRLRWHLERAMAGDDGLPNYLPETIWDEVLTSRLEHARSLPPVKIVRVDPRTWLL